jgi:P-type Ca2+ transporter type 2C
LRKTLIRGKRHWRSCSATATSARLLSRYTRLWAGLQDIGILILALVLFAVALQRGQGEVGARALSFTTAVLGNLALIWSNR